MNRNRPRKSTIRHRLHHLLLRRRRPSRRESNAQPTRSAPTSTRAGLPSSAVWISRYVPSKIPFPHSLSPNPLFPPQPKKNHTNHDQEACPRRLSPSLPTECHHPTACLPSHLSRLLDRLLEGRRICPGECRSRRQGVCRRFRWVVLAVLEGARGVRRQGWVVEGRLRHLGREDSRVGDDHRVSAVPLANDKQVDFLEQG